MTQTKKITLKSILLIVLASAMLVGCQSKSDKVIDVDALAKDSLAAAAFIDEVVEVDENVLLNIYGSLNIEDLTKYKVYVNGTSGKAEELAIFEAKDEEAAKRVMECVKERIEDLKFGFEGYKPEELKVLENAVSKQSGKYVFFAVGQNHEEINKVFENYLK